MLAREAECRREAQRQVIEAWWTKHFDHLRGFTELAVWFAALYALWPLWLWEMYKDPWEVIHLVHERVSDIRRTL